MPRPQTLFARDGMSGGAFRLCRRALLGSSALIPGKQSALLHRWTIHQRLCRPLCSAVAVQEAITAPDLLKNIPIGDHWKHVRGWVVFTDLHVELKSIDTCIEALHFVRAEAERRGYGIIFLGDFWENRYHAHFDALNRILPEVKKIAVPTLMIPGNHDQADRQGLVHGLSVLAAVNKHIHVFDGPTLFLGALWQPYRKRHEDLTAAFAAANVLRNEGHPLHTVFCHADIKGASYNAAHQNKDGLDPCIFPGDIDDVYSGHYHLPHRVPGSNITYPGSLYQVSKAEAGQTKEMLVLDARFRLLEKVEVPNIGPRNFTAQGDLSELHQKDLREGDKVTWTRPPGMSNEEALAQEQMLCAKFKGVEVTVLSPPREKTQARIKGAETLTPPDLLRSYVEGDHLEADDPGRLGMSWEALQSRVITTGHSILEDLQEQWPQKETAVRLVIDSVTMEGYGSFREKTRYNISSKGLRVISGRNELDDGSQSNGSGKSTLAMAALWALTGSDGKDSTLGKAKLAAAVHDKGGCKKAAVEVCGYTNDRPFMVKRAITLSKRGDKVLKHELEFWLDGVEMTQNDIAATQRLMDDTLGCTLMQSVIFNTQNDINQLLAAKDREFKQELGRLVDVDIWDAAKKESAAMLKDTKERLANLQGQLSRQSGKRESIEEQLVALRHQLVEWETTKQARMLALEEDLKAAGNGLRAHIAALRFSADSLRCILEAQQQLKPLTVEASDPAATLDDAEGFEERRQRVERLGEEHRSLQQRLSQQRMVLGNAAGQLQVKKNALSEYLQVGQDSEDSPECDRCMQPIDQKLFAQTAGRMQNDVRQAQLAAEEASAAASHLQAEVEMAEKELSAAVADLQLEQQEREYRKRLQAERLAELQSSYEAAANQSRRASEQVSQADAMLKRLQGALAGAGLADTGLASPDSSLEALGSDRLEDAMVGLTEATFKAQQSEGTFTHQAFKLHELKNQEAANPFLAEERRLASKLVEVAALEAEAEEQVAKLTEEVQVLRVLDKAFLPGGLRTFALEGILQDLEESTNEFLERLWPGTYLQLAYSKSDSSDQERLTKTLLELNDRGEYLPVKRTLSGGEERRLGMTLMLGFISQAWRRKRLQCNMLVLDEPLQQVDEEGCRRILGLLKELPKDLPGCDNIFLVCQANDYITPIFDKVDVVVKDANCCSYLEEA